MPDEIREMTDAEIARQVRSGSRLGEIVCAALPPRPSPAGAGAEESGEGGGPGGRGGDGMNAGLYNPALECPEVEQIREVEEWAAQCGQDAYLEYVLADGMAAQAKDQE